MIFLRELMKGATGPYRAVQKSRKSQELGTADRGLETKADNTIINVFLSIPS